MSKISFILPSLLIIGFLILQPFFEISFNSFQYILQGEQAVNDNNQIL